MTNAITSGGKDKVTRQMVCTDPPYPVIIGSGLLSSLDQLLPASLQGCKIAIVADNTVAALYGSAVEASLSAGGHAVSMFSFTPGEESKTLDTLGRILEFLAEQELDRSDAVLALGGGVTGDLAGFAAASYLRGINFVQVPTTLLAAVDSSVGGKTAVNLSKGKNLAGAFWQPVSVICDRDTLNTLPAEIYAEGIAEAVKCGVIGDLQLFGLLRQPMFPGSDNESEIISRCIAFKADIVREDEREQGKRALLNFGHTVAHALELTSGYRIRHGQAVAYGMIVATRAAEKEGFAEAGTLRELQSVLEVHGLDSLAFDFNISANGFLQQETLLEAMGADKKKRGDRITLVLPRRIGHCEPVKMSLEEARVFLKKGIRGR